MNVPKISVVTPSYNQGEFLEEAIRSVLEQEYPNLEYMVIDGGSDDNSVDIIKKHSDKLSYWVSEKDNGQSDAINKGFKRASGELVAWLNSDDYYLPCAFEKVAEAYNKNPDASFYFGDGLRVDRMGGTKSGYFPQGVHFDMRALLYGLNYILQPSTFMSRRIVEACGYLNEDLHYGMDTDLWIRLCLQAPPETIEAKLSASREYEETKTSKGLFARVEELRLIAEKHTGEQTTPGVLSYFMHSLKCYVSQTEQRGMYTADIDAAIDQLWGKFSIILKDLSGTDTGMPMRDYVPHKYYQEKQKDDQLSLEEKLVRSQEQLAKLHCDIDNLQEQLNSKEQNSEAHKINMASIKAPVLAGGRLLKRIGRKALSMSGLGGRKQ